MRILVLLVVLASLAGCTGPNAPIGAQPVVLSGAFTADRTQADLDDFDATLASHGIEEYALMESFPEQFRLELRQEHCHALRADLVEKEYLGHLSGCAAQ